MAGDKKSFNYANEIWNIADYVRDIVKRKDYNKVVLPFALLRRLECVLEPTREAVCDCFKKNESKWGREHDNYCFISNKPFYNVSNYRLSTLPSTGTLQALNNYIDAFSPNARSIMQRFKTGEVWGSLEEHDMLYEVCKRFGRFDLSPENVSDREMSEIYEHLIEKFGDEIAEDAEDFMTPKDVVRLAVTMVFANDDELMNSDSGIVRTLYDPTCGHCGFITDGLDLLDEWHSEKKMVAPASILPYGEEIEAENWAMGKASLLLRHTGTSSTEDLSRFIAYGDTLLSDADTGDAFPGKTFDYILSNPPYGKKWEKEQDSVNAEAAKGFNGRFGAGTPSISDGSMLFLQHLISKFHRREKDGSIKPSRAGIVLSASPLFNGDAGSGPSNIRRWILEQDYLDCVVKLPTDIFFRTGIATYLWILTNDKPANRKGMVQLIDASEQRTQLRKPKAKKRFELSQAQIDHIAQLYYDGRQTEESVIVPVTDFMFRKVTTQRPLRAKINVNTSKFEDLLTSSKPMSKLDADIAMALKDALGKEAGYQTWAWADEFAKAFIKSYPTKIKLTAAPLAKAIRSTFGETNSEWDVLLDKKGEIVPDPELKDFEQIPWGMDFGDYMTNEVLPYAEDAWIDQSIEDTWVGPDNRIAGGVGIVGTEISFNKYFYKYVQPEDPQKIADELLEMETDLETFMKEVFND